MSSTQAAAPSKSSDKETTKKREVTPPVQQEEFARQGTPSSVALPLTVADPRAARPAEILALQRRYGNQAVQRLLASRTVQAKLTVGAANDTYEQEADRVAAQVMASPALTPAPLAQRAGEEDEAQAQFVQREATPEEDKLQAQFVQRAPEDEELQAKAVVQRSGDGFAAGADFETQLSTARGGGTPLPDPTREFMEQRIGADFRGDVVQRNGTGAVIGALTLGGIGAAVGYKYGGGYGALAGGLVGGLIGAVGGAFLGGKQTQSAASFLASIGQTPASLVSNKPRMQHSGKHADSATTNTIIQNTPGWYPKWTAFVQAVLADPASVVGPLEKPTPAPGVRAIYQPSSGVAVFIYTGGSDVNQIATVVKPNAGTLSKFGL